MGSLPRVRPKGLFMAFRALPDLRLPKFSPLILQHPLPRPLHPSLHSTLLFTRQAGPAVCTSLFPLPRMFFSLIYLHNLLSSSLAASAKGSLLERPFLSTLNKIASPSLSINFSPAFILFTLYTYLYVYCLSPALERQLHEDKGCLLFTLMNSARHIVSAQ